MKKAVFTCVTGGYDTITPPQQVSPGWDYICFKDKDSKTPGGWDIIEVDGTMSSTRNARYIKILMPDMQDYDLTVWIDASFTITRDIQSHVDEYKGGVYTVMKHPTRKCIYDEAVACLDKSKDRSRFIMEQILQYQNEGYPRANGLLASGIIVRERSELTTKINQAWWEQVTTFSMRDQLSFNYVIWKNKWEVSWSDYNYLNEMDFTFRKHEKEHDFKSKIYRG